MIYRPQTLRSLRHKNYRIYFYAQLFSQSGSWMQVIALNWLVFRLTGSAALLGAITCVEQLPALLLSPISGVVCDRISLKHLTYITQCALTVLSLILALLAFTGHAQIWQIFVIGFITGCVTAFDLPARQTMLAYLVDSKDVANAIALNSSLYNCARIVGPAIAGIVIATWGEGVCFLLNAFSFLPMILGLYYIRFSRSIPQGKPMPFRDSFEQGLAYINQNRDIRRTMILNYGFCFMGFSFMVLMPAMAAQVYQGDSRLLGLLMSITGIGAVVGSLVLASRKHLDDLSKNIAFFGMAFGGLIMMFGLSRNLVVSLSLLATTGFFMVTLMSSANTFIQTKIPMSLRGRVLSIYSIGFTGFSPLGALLAGKLSSRIGAPQTIVMSGVFCLSIAVLYALKSEPELKTTPEATSNVLLADIEV